MEAAGRLDELEPANLDEKSVPLSESMAVAGFVPAPGLDVIFLIEELGVDLARLNEPEKIQGETRKNESSKIYKGKNS